MMIIYLALIILLLQSLVLCNSTIALDIYNITTTTTSSSSLKYKWDSNIPARLQWLHNDGYCGEVSTIMALLKFGNYISQYDFRDIASKYSTLGDPSKPQQTQFYLVGENDQEASSAVKLNSIEYDHSIRNAQEYLAWCKKMITKGHTITITVYMNYYLFYGTTDPNAGEWDYDHIVSISKIESNYDDDLYHDDDVLTMEDHGLWAPRKTGPQYLFSYTFKDFPGTREDANTQTDSNKIYTLPSSKTAGQFGICHTGVIDLNKELLPITVNTNVNYESPEIPNHSETRPPAMNITLTVTVSGLNPNTNYVLYKYDDENKVPIKDFNKNKNNAVKVIEFIGPENNTNTYTIIEEILSNEKAFYRAVVKA